MNSASDPRAQGLALPGLRSRLIFFPLLFLTAATGCQLLADDSAGPAEDRSPVNSVAAGSRGPAAESVPWGTGRAEEDPPGQSVSKGAEGAAAESVPGAPGTGEETALKFSSGGRFKIVQFTDTQDDQDIDPRTVALLEAVLEDQKPDLVVFTGDNVRSGPQTPEDVRQAIRHIVDPVDSRGIPWFITFGNHDEDHTEETGMDEAALLAEYMSYPNNINRWSPEGVSGTGNMHALVMDSSGQRPVFNIWALDSGRYSPDTIAGQSIQADGLPGWDVIRPDQVWWYHQTSQELEARYGQSLPALAFFHIPLQEFHLLWENRERHDLVGEKNEEVSSGPFNSGLFAAMLDRGDVKGIYVGHDHVNDYEGNYFGIRLGYAASAGFGTYGLDGSEEDRLRGARVFVLNETYPKQFESWMVYARDYGIQ